MEENQKKKEDKFMMQALVKNHMEWYGWQWVKCIIFIIDASVALQNPREKKVNLKRKEIKRMS